MVGKVFNVVFSRKAQRRRREISEFETRSADAKKASKVQHQIDKSATKLEQMPAARPQYQKDADGTVYRYIKAFRYKLIYKIFEAVGDVFIVTIRHDREDPDVIKRDL